MQSQSICAIVNAHSGGSTQKSLSKWSTFFADHNIRFEITESQEQLKAIILDLDKNHQRNVVILGGDGSLNTLINQLFAAFNNLDEWTLGCIPMGTGNDWASHHKLPKKTEALRAFLKKPSFMPVPMGVISDQKDNQRAFMNIAGSGFDAFVVDRINRVRQKKIWTYITEVVRALPRYEAKSMELNIDGNHSQMEVYSVHLGFGTRSGGGLAILQPNGRMDEMAYTIIKKAPVWRYLVGLPLLLTGGFDRLSFVQTGMVKELTIRCDEDQFGLEADGEFQSALPVSVTVHERPIKVWATQNWNKN